jgi:hypothetical protein
VHVWAYPLNTGDPIFLGVAAYRYGIAGSGLEPGTYDLAVFVWSTVRGGFVPANVVRVTVR